ncbi:MAG: OmpA family protein, partial [Myxococcota bacterium]
SSAESIPAGAPTDDAALAEMRAGVRFPAEFSFNDWRPRGVVQAELDRMVDKLGHCPDRIRVTGHSDQKGTDWANDTFALARAGEVRRILGTRGIDRRRIEVTSSGSADPEADADTPEGRAYNRRVIVRCY